MKKRMGCGCDMSCACMDKGLGQGNGKNSFNPVWFLVGAASGVGLWYLLRNMTGPAEQAARTGPGQTVAAPLPPIAAPSRFGDLNSVAIRLDQVKTLYRSGQLTPAQAGAEAVALRTAAVGFFSTDPNGPAVLADIDGFLAQIVDFQEFLQSQAQPIA